jgi:iron complex outermembrane receptor protein
MTQARVAPAGGTHRRRLPLAVIAALGAVALVVPPAASAQSTVSPRQDTPQSLPTVVVTGTRIPEPEFDVPASISVVTSKNIRSGPPGTNLAQTLARVPGLVAQNRQSLAQDLQLSLRGFGARASFGVTGIRLLVDGLPYSDPDGQGQTDPFDLAAAERVEVLRGPFSVLYGNAAGGVIQVFTKDGPARPEVGADLMVGSYGTVENQLNAGGTTGSFNYMANVSWFQTDGYREHSAAKRDHLYSKLRYEPSDNASLTFIFNAENQPFAEDPSALSAEQVTEDPRQAVSRVFQFGSGEFHRHRQGGVVYEQKLGEHDRLQATAWLGSRRVVQFLPFSGDDPLSGGAVIDLDNDAGGGDARWTHDAAFAGFPLTTTAGFDYQRLHERRKGFVNDDGRKGPLARNEDDILSRLGAYAQAQWKLGRWQLVGGVRQSRVNFEVDDHFINDVDPDDSGSQDFSQATGFASVLYELASTVNAYASFGRGFETPSFAELAYRPDGTSGLNFDLRPSTSNNYEAGLKADFGLQGKLRLALYKIDTADEIVTATSANGRSTFRNAGSTTRKGVELSLQGGLGGSLHGYLAWTWLQADFAAGPFAGKRLPGVPRTTLYGELNWTYAPVGFYALASAQLRTRVFADDGNAQAAPSYVVANMEAGFGQQTSGWRFREFAQLNNMFDRHYIGAVVVNATNGRFFEPEPNRNWLVGVNASYSF